MIWQIWADILTGLAIPATTIFLYCQRYITRKHIWLMAWGFFVGSTWEFTFYFLGDTVHTMKVNWPMPIITLHLWHTFWDAGLFIMGYWLCLLVLKTSDCSGESFSESSSSSSKFHLITVRGVRS